MRGVARHSNAVSYTLPAQTPKRDPAAARFEHIEGGERSVQLNRREPNSAEMIAWGPLEQATDGVKVRHGQGQSGVRYWLVAQGSWKVMIATSTQRGQEIGSARMQDHARGLADMWERAVLAGRIDV